MRKIRLIPALIILLCSLAMIPANYVPVWQILLEAPQYPEGMKMEIWSSKIAGNINNINNLNHYIGMSIIEEKNFPEFKYMPSMIWAMVILGVLVFFIRRLAALWAFAGYLILCGVWGIYDFWKWEFAYGHNLDPHAAIKIPGMAYQPPLFGWKYLLNFLAGSFPDIGGWLIIGPAIIIVVILVLEQFIAPKK